MNYPNKKNFEYFIIRLALRDFKFTRGEFFYIFKIKIIRESALLLLFNLIDNRERNVFPQKNL